MERQELKRIMTEKVQALDAIDTNIARQRKNGEWRIAQELVAKQFQVETSIVHVVRLWIQKGKAPISQSTQTEVETSRYYEPLNEAMCRERDMWKMRTSDLLDLLLCEDCCVEKEEVFYTGSREEIIGWTPDHFNGNCYKVHCRFEDGYA